MCSLCFLLLASCNKLQQAGKSTAQPTEAQHAEAPTKGSPASSDDPGVDAGLGDPTLPALPTGKSKGPDDSDVGFNPIKSKGPKVPNVKFEGPSIPKVGDTSDPGEHVQQPLPTP